MLVNHCQKIGYIRLPTQIPARIVPPVPPSPVYGRLPNGWMGRCDPKNLPLMGPFNKRWNSFVVYFRV